jgi:hypothetical protein
MYVYTYEVLYEYDYLYLAWRPELVCYSTY